MSEKTTELLSVLEELGVDEFLSIHDNPEEVRQLCNKIGRPELFKACIDEVNNRTTEIASNSRSAAAASAPCSTFCDTCECPSR